MKAVKNKFKGQMLARQQRQASLAATAAKTVAPAHSSIKPTPPEAAASNQTKVQQLLVDESSEQQRLDNFLVKQLKGVPKSFIYRIVRDGQVRVNKKRATAADRLQLGDIVRVPPLRMSKLDVTKAQQFIPARQFSILYEDECLLAINKPAGLAVHGGSGINFGVIEQLRRSRPQAKYLELVHRLDRETSGILLIAKKRSALVNLQQQFAGRSVQKAYLALAVGEWAANNKVIDLPLYKYQLMVDNGAGQSQEERRVKVVTKEDQRGQRALSLVKVQQVIVSELATFSLLEVTIKTGRTHQIRVHLQSQGHPIAGDDKYGDFALNKQLQKQGLERMFLHAWRLSLKHPKSQQELAIEADLAPELASFIAKTQGATYA